MLFRRICQGQLKNDIEEAYLGRSQTSMTELLWENTPEIIFSVIILTYGRRNFYPVLSIYLTNTVDDFLFSNYCFESLKALKRRGQSFFKKTLF